MNATVLRADARRLPLPDASVDLICTSPPYWSLRSYTDGGEHYDGQIGAEPTPHEYVAALLECTREWMRVLKPSGSIFVLLGDKYASSGGHGASATSARADRKSHRAWAGRAERNTTGAQAKSLMLLPERYRIGCTDGLGLIARKVIIWSKPNGLPESVTDRVRSTHEDWVHLVKQPRYYAALDEIREPYEGDRLLSRRIKQPGEGKHAQRAAWDGSTASLGRLPGSVWEVATQPLKAPPHLGVDHYAAFPPALIRRIILGWTPPGICITCGEGRRPISDKRHEGGWNRLTPSTRVRSGTGHGGGGESLGDQVKNRLIVTITGYTCACPTPDASTRAAIVLDPFGGTGTTALVASVHGRHGISVDMSADYCRLATWRVNDPAERARALGIPKPPPVPDGQGDLFEAS